MRINADFTARSLVRHDTQDWLRLPVGSGFHATAGPQVWIKSGHLRPMIGVSV